MAKFEGFDDPSISDALEELYDDAVAAGVDLLRADIEGLMREGLLAKTSEMQKRLLAEPSIAALNEWSIPDFHGLKSVLFHNTLVMHWLRERAAGRQSDDIFREIFDYFSKKTAKLQVCLVLPMFQPISDVVISSDLTLLSSVAESETLSGDLQLAVEHYLAPGMSEYSGVLLLDAEIAPAKIPRSDSHHPSWDRAWEDMSSKLELALEVLSLESNSGVAGGAILARSQFGVGLMATFYSKVPETGRWGFPTLSVVSKAHTRYAAIWRLDERRRQNFVRVLRRYNQSLLDKDPVDACINLAIAYESLLIGTDGDGKTEISYKIASRAAWLSGVSVEHRQRIFDNLRSLYDYRSKAAHQGVLKGKFDFGVLKRAQEHFPVMVDSMLDRGGALTHEQWKLIVLGGGHAPKKEPS
ncbi:MULTISPECIES: hypothetical protein [Alphaproteobacteria]|uniref:hypothetical protein n=1 Tax=Alphaproteobacteria TaxID=28211 RepID=UPI00329704B5